MVILYMKKSFSFKRIYLLVFLLSVSMLPSLALGAPATFADLADMIIGWVNLAVPSIVAFALFAFLFGLVLFLKSAGDSKKHADGIKIMTYGIISLFVIVGVWGIVEMAKRTIFGSDSVAVPSSSSIVNTFNIQ